MGREMEIKVGIEDDLKHLVSELAGIKETLRQVRGLVGPVGFTLPNGLVLTQSIHGQLYYIDPDDTIIAPQMLIFRQWEAPLSAIVKELCKTASTFVDVGANFGYFTCLAAANLPASNPQRQVIAIEPNPKLAPLLQKNAQINWSVAPIRIVEAAVAENEGVASLYIPRERGANATLSVLETDDIQAVDVPMMRLDDVIGEIAVDIMKIDTEGHELGALRGAKVTLEMNPNIVLIMEWSRAQTVDAGYRLEEVASFLKEFGFSPYRAVPSENLFSDPLSWQQLLDTPYDNFLFRRPG